MSIVFFFKYSLLEIKLELPSFNKDINLSTKQLDFNANCLLLNYTKFCKHADMLAYESLLMFFSFIVISFIWQ